MRKNILREVIHKCYPFWNKKRIDKIVKNTKWKKINSINPLH